MTEKILLVDDEPNVLHALTRQLRKRFDLRTAESGEAALRLLKTEGPFAVIVSDMRMPEMNGVELLATVKTLYPDTVRLMLTGNADQETAIEAVNSGQIFRFLTKPCPPALLITSLVLALRQHRLLTAEQELLQNTLRGSVSVLCELLGMANPLACSAGLRIRAFVVAVAAALRLPQPWQYEMAALLSQIGCIGLPGEILRKVYSGQQLDADEAERFAGHPEAAAKLLEPIPRLENVTAMIRHQRRRYADFTDELRQGLFAEVLVGAHISARPAQGLQPRGARRPGHGAGGQPGAGAEPHGRPGERRHGGDGRRARHQRRPGGGKGPEHHPCPAARADQLLPPDRDRRTDPRPCRQVRRG